MKTSKRAEEEKNGQLTTTGLAEGGDISVDW